MKTNTDTYVYAIIIIITYIYCSFVEICMQVLLAVFWYGTY